MKTNRNGNHKYLKTSQELQMLSSVTINCQLTKIVINPGSQFRGEYFSKNLYFCTTPKKALQKKAAMQ